MSAVLTPRELDELKKSVGDAVARPERLLDILELAKELRIRVSTIERRVRAGQIPIIQTGRIRRFRLSSVMKALEG